MATSPPPTSPAAAKDSVERIGKTITTAAAIIGLVVTINTFVASCSKEQIDRATNFRTVVKGEEQFWSGLYGQFLAAVNDGDKEMSQRKSKLMAIAMLATHRNPDFSEFTAWYESPDRAEAETKRLDQMRRVLLEALTDAQSSNPDIARAIEFFLDQKSAVRDRLETEEKTDQSPPQVTEQAQAATDAKAQGQAPVVVQLDDVKPFYGSRILARGSATGWDVDVFWCVGGANENDTFKRSVTMASALAAAAQNGSKIGAGVTLGRIRLRSLPASQQSNGLFYARGDSVVADNGKGEKEAAAAVGALLSKASGTSLRQVTSVGVLTNWYLSVFVCPTNPPAANATTG
jgi:hypothetical protein